MKTRSMKCVCGYAYFHTPNPKNRKEPFIELSGSVIIKEDDVIDPHRIKKGTAYACPKCGTVRIEV